MTGKLTYLVRVDYLRRPISLDSLFRYVQAAGSIQTIGYTPSDNITVSNTYNGCQIKKTFGHRDISNVNGPYLVLHGNLVILRSFSKYGLIYFA